jgi:serine/threonine-protein kinase
MHSDAKGAFADAFDEENLSGVLIDERYRLTTRLGGGGMGTVYRAIHEGLGREVAVKVLRAELCTSRRSIERFMREARAVGSIGHPNVVAIHDVGSLPDGRPYLVMELLTGRDLRRIMKERRRCSVEAAARLLRGPAEALDALHAQGMLHRDIKPENLVVVPQPGGGDVVKVIDFGLAAFTHGGQRLTTLGTVCGTPQYMAPEGANPAMPDGRADVYSLATVAFELIAGRAPFVGRVAAQVLANKLYRDAPLLSDVALMPVPVAAEQLFTRALSRNPEHRPATSTQFIAELARAAHAPAEMLDTGWMWRSPERLVPPATAPEPEPAPELPRAPITPTVESRPRRDPDARLVSALRLKPPPTPAVPTPAAFAAAPSVAPQRKQSRLALSLAIAAPFVVGLALFGAIALAYAMAVLLPAEVGVDRAGIEPAPAANEPSRRNEARPKPAPSPDEAGTTAHEETNSPVNGEAPASVANAREPRHERPHSRAQEPAADVRSRVQTAPIEQRPTRDTDRATADERVRDADRHALRGELHEAARLYAQATDARPGDARAWRGLGIVSERLGRTGDATRAFTRYLALAPNAPDADRIRGRLDAL